MEKTYCLGSYSCIELLKSNKAKITKCIIQKSYKTQEGCKILFRLLPKNIPVETDEKFLKKISFKENIYVALEFTPYEINFDDSPIVILEEDDEGVLGSIIRTAVGFNFKNIAIISRDVNVFSTKLLRSSMGSFYLANVKTFKNEKEIKNQFRNKMIFIKKDKKIPYHIFCSIELYKRRQN